MALVIDDLLSSDTVGAIRQSLGQDGSLWRDGTSTAAGQARSVKANQQADPDHRLARAAMEKIRTALLAHPAFRAFAQPDQIVRIMLSRYNAGMAYGDHVDAAIIDGARADLSFTVFLSDPDDYAGGALVIDQTTHEDRFREPAGTAVIYSASTVHRVEPVERGHRLACVGWVRSRIACPETRRLLFELDRTIGTLKADSAVDPAMTVRLSNVRNGLLRLLGS